MDEDELSLVNAKIDALREEALALRYAVIALAAALSDADRESAERIPDIIGKLAEELAEKNPDNPNAAFAAAELADLLSRIIRLPHEP